MTLLFVPKSPWSWPVIITVQTTRPRLERLKNRVNQGSKPLYTDQSHSQLLAKWLKWMGKIFWIKKSATNLTIPRKVMTMFFLVTLQGQYGSQKLPSPSQAILCLKLNCFFFCLYEEWPHQPNSYHSLPTRRYQLWGHLEIHGLENNYRKLFGCCCWLTFCVCLSVRVTFKQSSNALNFYHFIVLNYGIFC